MKKHITTSHLTRFLLTALTSVAFVLTSSYLYAQISSDGSTFTEPAGAPPGYNTNTPLNVGTSPQSKAPTNVSGTSTLNIGGVFSADGITSFGNAAIGGNLYVTSGNVGIGSTTPSQKLSVTGNVAATQFCLPGSLPTGGCVSNWTTIGGGGSTSSTSTVSGTLNKFAKFTASNAIGNSILTESGSNVTLGSVNSSIQIGLNDATQGFWIRNDGSNPVISTKIGDIFMGYSGRSGMVWRFGASGTGMLISNDAPANAFTIASNGNIGVGKAAGGVAMDVVGQVRADGASAGVMINDRSTNRQWQLYGSNDSFRLYNGAADALTVDTVGNITAGAIGTAGSLPSDKPSGWAGGVSTYDVVAKASVRANQFCIGGGINSTATGTCITSWPTGSGSLSGTTNKITKFTSSSAVGDSQITDTGTNVGVGIAVPTQKLSVNGTMSVNGRIFTGNGGGMWFDSDLTNNGHQFVGAISSTQLGFYNDGWNFVLDNSGKVGIGTVSPSQRLDVAGNVNVGGNLYGSNGTEFQIAPANAGGNLRLDANDNTAGDVTIGLIKARAVEVFASGEPVSGTVFAVTKRGSPASFVLDTSNNGNFSGSVTANAFYYQSDERLKTNIKTLGDSLSKILQLRGVSFNWKETGKSNIGLIAQEVEKVYPDAVTTNEKTGIKSVEYANLVAPLIEAVKDQQKQIEALKVEIENLKK